MFFFSQVYMSDMQVVWFEQLMEDFLSGNCSENELLLGLIKYRMIYFGPYYKGKKP